MSMAVKPTLDAGGLNRHPLPWFEPAGASPIRGRLAVAGQAARVRAMADAIAPTGCSLIE